MTVDGPILILFDIDGTLLRSDGCGRHAVNCAVQELFGLLAIPPEVTFAGTTDWNILEQIMLPLGHDHQVVADAMPAFAEAISRHLDETIHQFAVDPLPGALALIDALAEDPRFRLGLVTGNVAESVPIKLRTAGFDPDHFPVGAYGHEASNRDELPPLALQRAQDHWQEVYASEKIVIIGDTPADIICARAVSGRAIGVLTGGPHISRERLAAERPYALLNDLTNHDAVMDVLLGRL